MRRRSTWKKVTVCEDKCRTWQWMDRRLHLPVGPISDLFNWKSHLQTSQRLFHQCFWKADMFNHHGDTAHVKEAAWGPAAFSYLFLSNFFVNHLEVTNPVSNGKTILQEICCYTCFVQVILDLIVYFDNKLPVKKVTVGCLSFGGVISIFCLKTGSFYIGQSYFLFSLRRIGFPLGRKCT